MATTINTSADLIALLRNNKEFREDVRRFVLTDEMLAMPDVIRSIDARLGALEASYAKMQETQQQIAALLEQVMARQDQMATRQTQMAERQDQMAMQQTQMAERQDRTDERLDRMDKRMDGFDARFDEVDARFDAVDAKFAEVDARFDAVDAKFAEVDARFDAVDARFDASDAKFDALTKRVTNIEAIVRGEAFERRMYSRLLPRLPMEYDITRVHAVSVDPQASIRVPDFRARDFENEIEELRSRGVISDDDVDNINNTDMVVQSLRRADRSRLWFAVQATVTIRDDAITRAHAGAESLRKAFGQEVIAVAYGRRITAHQRRLADELGVATLIDSWEREEDAVEESAQ